MREPKLIIVAGASAGGLNAFCEFVAQFQEDTDAAIFLVLHLSKVSVGSFLLNRLQQFTNLPCSLAQDGLPIEKGHVYIAPPDFHLVVKKGSMIIANGPHENRWRPSIDVLFRSAAAAYGERVIGVVLTGLLDDGSAGMAAIKRAGGTTIVQDPNEAEYPDMPLGVLNKIEVDYCLPLAQVGYIIYDIIANKKLAGKPIPEEIIAEAAIAERTITNMEEVKRISDVHSLYACPDCGGGLWEIQEEQGRRRYRCHIGHGYSEEDFMKKQAESIESTLWVALRIMEERKSVLQRIGREEIKKGLKRLGDNHLQMADDMQKHIDALKQMLLSTPKNNS